jgi:hypothetical protein
MSSKPSNLFKESSTFSLDPLGFHTTSLWIAVDDWLFLNPLSGIETN